MADSSPAPAGGCQAATPSRPAGPGRVSVAYGGDARPYVIDVVRLEPQGYASFRWASAFGGAEPAPGRATLVEFYLRPVGDEIGRDGGGERLRVARPARGAARGRVEGQPGRLAVRARRTADPRRAVSGSFADPERVFAALADPRRRELLELLARAPGASAGGLAAALPVSRQAVAQHLAVLEEARLVTRASGRASGAVHRPAGRPDGHRGLADRPRGRLEEPIDSADQGEDPLL